jgi:response regulator RpfG family c-di-GMP phosphodiesterase
MLEKILMVDDDGSVLAGYQRLFRNEFQIDTAAGGAAALAAIEKTGPYALVISDMRMPEMDGVELLARIKLLAPEAIRIMLTGNADIQTAVRAVNEGSIFRFLTKPCNKETLGRAFTAGLMQYRLVAAEKELLEKTLQGSIQVLTDVLSLVNPAAFGRAARVRRYIRHIVSVLRLPNPWRFEVAGMMSQLGCVTLDPDTIEAAYARRRDFTPEEKKLFDGHPKVARDLLAKIPRMEPIAWMIAHQNEDVPIEGDLADQEMADMRLGASILRVALAFDELVRLDMSKTEAAHRLSKQHNDLDPRIFEALVELRSEEHELRDCRIDQLQVGMILRENLKTKDGLLIVAKGQEVTQATIIKLNNLHSKGALQAIVKVGVPQQIAAAAVAGN